MNKYYLYRHIRLDTNQPFYIGIGTKIKSFNSFKTEYKRAFVKKGRETNPHWNNIINKIKYRVEILLESDNYEFIKEKEIDFIKLYGRIDLKTGILVNLTDGGEGQKGVKKGANPQQIEKIKLWYKNNKGSFIPPMLGKKHTEETKLLIKKSQQKKLIQKDKNDNIIKIWDSIEDAHNNGYDKNGISRAISGKSGKSNYKRRTPYYKNYKWELQNKN